MSGTGSQCHMMEQPCWSSPSASPSPPPPPLPPPVAARWARMEQNSADSCPHCRGRLASLPTRTTSLSSYSCKGQSQLEREEILTFSSNNKDIVDIGFSRIAFQICCFRLQLGQKIIVIKIITEGFSKYM